MSVRWVSLDLPAPILVKICDNHRSKARCNNTCAGVYGNRIGSIDVLVHLKPFLDDLKRGRRWYAELHTKCTIGEGDHQCAISGIFRHIDCSRISSSSLGFTNFRCIACSSIPREFDFRMRAYRSKLSKFVRGNRTCGGGRRLGYFGV